MAINFVSLISRDNQPLYIQQFSPYEPKEDDFKDSSKSKDDKDGSKPAVESNNSEQISFVKPETRANELLKYNFLSHMALDVFDSPMAPMAEVEPAPGRIYQLLFVHEGIFVFGQETNTGLKIVVGCSRNENIVKDSPGLNDVFQKVYKVYLRLICNPFIGSDTIDQDIDNSQFDERVKRIVTRWNDLHS